jgi:hypothetical protein
VWGLQVITHFLFIIFVVFATFVAVPLSQNLQVHSEVDDMIWHFFVALLMQPFAAFLEVAR